MGQILQHHEDILTDGLVSIPPRLRAAFAAACTERLAPTYVRGLRRQGLGDAELFRLLLNRLWDAASTGDASQEDIQSWMDQRDQIAPTEDSVTRIDERADLDAPTVALAAGFEAISSDNAQAALTSSRQCIEVLLIYASLTELAKSGRQSGKDTSDVNEDMQNPLIQAEMERQRLDLHELQLAQRPAESSALLARLRARAKFEAETFFG